MSDGLVGSVAASSVALPTQAAKHTQGQGRVHTYSGRHSSHLDARK